MTWLITAAALTYIGIAVFAVVLCKSAARSDQHLVQPRKRRTAPPAQSRQGHSVNH